MTKSLKYLLALTIPMFGFISLANEGILAWSGTKFQNTDMKALRFIIHGIQIM